jgi:hypothetical protein
LNKKISFIALGGCHNLFADLLKVFCFFFSKKKALLPASFESVKTARPLSAVH